ncbi:MAG: RpiB/LacA/LacB family sugar-phosphate isomerase [Planctomycetota bacterium]
MSPIGAVELRSIAARAARRAAGGATVAPFAARGTMSDSPSPAGSSPEESTGERDLVAESLVRAAPAGSELVVPPHARITPLARELAFLKDVRFVAGRTAEPLGPVPGEGIGGRASRRIAVASDHGGFALKDQLLPLLREMGERPFDLGPDSGDVSVDYPDFARRVATEVSEGRADVGVIVDGAGIGSAMVANKLPGVLAANCWNAASARNAREHNHANVLTLGSGHLDLAAARDVIAAFLGTPVGEGRHERRWRKTVEVEQDHLRARDLARTYQEGRS